MPCCSKSRWPETSPRHPSTRRPCGKARPPDACRRTIPICSSISRAPTRPSGARTPPMRSWTRSAARAGSGQGSQASSAAHYLRESRTDAGSGGYLPPRCRGRDRPASGGRGVRGDAALRGAPRRGRAALRLARRAGELSVRRRPGRRERDARRHAGELRARREDSARARDRLDRDAVPAQAHRKAARADRRLSGGRPRRKPAQFPGCRAPRASARPIRRSFRRRLRTLQPRGELSARRVRGRRRPCAPPPARSRRIEPRRGAAVFLG